MAAIAEREIVPCRVGLSAAKQALLTKWFRGESSNIERAKPRRIPRRTKRGRAPLSFAQQGLWFFNQLDSASPLYNIVVAVRINGDLEPAALQKALDAIVMRHEILHTHFTAQGDKPMQRIGVALPVPMRMIDLRGQPHERRETEAARLLHEEAGRSFDLARDILIRALLIQTEQREWSFLVVMHHIASDLLSWRVLCQELARLYQSQVSGRPTRLPELPIQYADFAMWQRDRQRNGVLVEDIAYWRRQLAEAPRLLELPADYPRPPVQTFRGAFEYLVLPAKLNERLNDLSRLEGVTLFMTLLAAFQTLLHRYTGQEDVLVGSPIGGRTQVELEPLIGLFVNTLVLRANFTDNPNFRELLAKVRTIVLEALTHQEVRFDKLVEELKPERSASYSPLIQVLFAHHTAPAHSFQLPGLTVSPLDVDTGTAKFDLTLFVLETDGALTCATEYNIGLFKTATIRRLLGHYQRLLEGIVTNPEHRISELPLIPASERHRLLVEWNDTHMDVALAGCAHQLFEIQAEKTPEAVALVCEDQQLSYQELNQRANQLGHCLQDLGVGPESLVALCLDRSPEMVVGLLGIMKAGGAYLPLDPSYPNEWLRFMLEDSRAGVLLTQQRRLNELPGQPTRTSALMPIGRESPIKAKTIRPAM